MKLLEPNRTHFIHNRIVYIKLLAIIGSLILFSPVDKFKILSRFNCLYTRRNVLIARLQFVNLHHFLCSVKIFALKSHRGPSCGLCKCFSHHGSCETTESPMKSFLALRLSITAILFPCDQPKTTIWRRSPVTMKWPLTSAVLPTPCLQVRRSFALNCVSSQFPLAHCC